jgi:Caspase domain
MRPVDPHRSYAVLIGTSRYRSDKLSDLDAVANNLDDLVAVLTDPKLCGFRPDHCRVLLNKDSNQIVEDLFRYAQLAEDTLLIYYAGHGLPGPRATDLYLTLPDTDPDNPLLWRSALAYDEIRRILLESGRVRAENRVVVLDCCFAGRAIPEMAGQITDMLGIRGAYILTATTDKPAYAPAGQRNTAFTEELLGLLRGGVSGGPEWLTLDAVYGQLLRRLVARGLPEPKQMNIDTVASLALARNRAYLPRETERAPRQPVPVLMPYSRIRPARMLLPLLLWILKLALPVAGFIVAEPWTARNPWLSMVGFVMLLYMAGATRSAMLRSPRAPVLLAVLLVLLSGLLVALHARDSTWPRLAWIVLAAYAVVRGVLRPTWLRAKRGFVTVPIGELRDALISLVLVDPHPFVHLSVHNGYALLTYTKSYIAGMTAAGRRRFFRYGGSCPHCAIPPVLHELESRQPLFFHGLYETYLHVVATGATPYLMLNPGNPRRWYQYKTLPMRYAPRAALCAEHTAALY